LDEVYYSNVNGLKSFKGESEPTKENTTPIYIGDFISFRHHLMAQVIGCLTMRNWRKNFLRNTISAISKPRITRRLPPDFIDNLKETLTDIEFDVEVEGNRLGKTQRRFAQPSIYIPIARRSWSIIKQINLWNYRSISMPTLRAALWQPEGWELREIADAFVKTPKNNMTMARP
jgi:hypothetical protein